MTAVLKISSARVIKFCCIAKVFFRGFISVRLIHYQSSFNRDQTITACVCTLVREGGSTFASGSSSCVTVIHNCIMSLTNYTWFIYSGFVYTAILFILISSTDVSSTQFFLIACFNLCRSSLYWRREQGS